MNDTKQQNNSDSSNTGAGKKEDLMKLLVSTPPAKISELDFVKEKFIKNYNYCHANKVGELMYHRQQVYFTQLILASEDLQKADRFSLYACFVTAAVKGWSFDPQDGELYMVPLKGKAVLWPQAPAYVRRLIVTGQIKSADQPVIVYKGDDFEVEKGRVIKHVRKFTSEEYIAAYMRFVLDDNGSDRYFVYEKADWIHWKIKSPMSASSDTWSGGINKQPVASFLRTKVVKHSCKAKSWASGTSDPRSEQFSVVMESDTKDELTNDAAPASAPGEETSFDNHEEVSSIPAAGVIIEDEEEAGF